MSSPREGDQATQKQQCRVAEIVQHSCHAFQDSQGRDAYECFPVLRFFQICKGRPAVEITKFIHLDPKDGGVEIPAGFRDEDIQGRPWRDVVRYDIPLPDDKQPSGSHSVNAS